MPTTEPKQTIQSLFSTDAQFAVPSYQRAYSWEEKHLKLFLKDLREQPDGCPYYLGHFIFEKDKDKPEIYLIDGQQRMTTIALFMATAASILKEQGQEEISNTFTTRYISNDLGLRFNTVEDDLDLFEEIIKDDQFRSKADTNSKKRLIFANEYLRKQLAKEPIEIILHWADIIENAHVTTFTVHNKIQATQIFTLQNSRGKELSELEKLKAYLMYQIYLNDEEHSANRSISSIEKQFEIIYRECGNTQIDEDDILRYHDRAYSPYWDTPTKNIERQIKEIGKNTEEATEASKSKVEFIKEFCKQLATTFQDIIELEKISSHNEYIADPIILDPPNAWPFLLKFYHIFGPQIATEYELCQILRNIEITLVKFDFQHGRSSNDLIGTAKRLQGKSDLEWLSQHFVYCSQHSFRNSGNFNSNFIGYLNGYYHYHNIVRYMLWKYENHSRLDKESKVSPQEYRNEVASKRMDSTTEHIAPKQPQEDIYDQEFKDRYIHNLGNLLFMPKGLNSSLNNKPPEVKAEVLKDLTFATFRSVANSINSESDCECNLAWCSCKIEARKANIIEFALDRWEANLLTD